MSEPPGYIPYPETRYPGRRRAVYAPNGMVATSQPLAAQAGVAMLQAGGNAVDAALAAAAVLCVVEPASCGPGGDAFALVWDGERLHGLNGSGRSPQAANAHRLRAAGHTAMPARGWESVSVPGAPAAWAELHRRFGRLPLVRLFEPAIAYAQEGFPLARIAQYGWAWSWIKLRAALSAEEFGDWAQTFAPQGHAPRPGELWRCPALGATLQAIAETGAETIYRGALAEKIAAHAARAGADLSAADLAAHRSEWVAPIHTDYRGYEVWEIPPNTQGLAALLALNILEGFELGALPRESVEAFHLQLEAMKLAFADARRYVADPAAAEVPVQELLSKAYAKERRRLITPQAAEPAPGDPWTGGTAYLAAADQEGMQVSLIQSVYSGFGSGITIPGTGIVLQNRGSGFSLQAGHPNELAPGKRPFHTIIPAFLTRAGQPVGPFGVMGGHMQPQGHVQMVVNTVDYGLDPQEALDAPRWFWWDERYVKLEPALAGELAEGLAARGHEVEVDPDVDVFGGGQIIWRNPDGGYIAGSDNRKDGCAIGY